MCNTTGPKMFFQPSELGSQGNDMAQVHASNPQATFDAGNPANFPAPPQPPPATSPTPPTPRGGPFGRFGPGSRFGGLPGMPRFNWREGEGLPDFSGGGGYTPFAGLNTGGATKQIFGMRPFSAGGGMSPYSNMTRPRSFQNI